MRADCSALLRENGKCSGKRIYSVDKQLFPLVRKAIKGVDPDWDKVNLPGGKNGPVSER